MADITDLIGDVEPMSTLEGEIDGLMLGGNGSGINEVYLDNESVKEGDSAYLNSSQIAFYGLANAAGDTSQKNSGNAVGTYTDTAKDKIKDMLEIPKEGEYVKSIYVDGMPASPTSEVSLSMAQFAFYGLGLAAGYIRVNDETLGIYSDAAKQKIKAMLGINETSGGGSGSGSGGGLSAASASDVKAGSSLSVALTPYLQSYSVFYGLASAAGDTSQASSSNAVGAYTDDAKQKIKAMLGISDSGGDGLSDIWLGVTPLKNGTSAIIPVADTDAIKSGSGNTSVLTPGAIAKIVFYGLAAAAGDTTQKNSSNAIGTYTDDAKRAIKTLLDISESTGGDGGGLAAATDSQVRNGVTNDAALTPEKQAASVFYGLAAAAGNVDQRVSSNAIGTYTSAAKTSIKAMLDIIPAKSELLDSGTTFTASEQATLRAKIGIIGSAEGVTF